MYATVMRENMPQALILFRGSFFQKKFKILLHDFDFK